MNTEQAFHDQLDAEPWDWATRLMFADFLDGIGDERLAYAQRWMSENETEPSSKSGRLWTWHPFREDFVVDRFRLPTETFRRINTDELYLYFDSRRDAEQALADALATLADAERRTDSEPRGTSAAPTA